MRVPRRGLFCAAVVLVLWLSGAEPMANGGFTPCTRVISIINHTVTAEHGNPADLSAVARKLGTSVTWVEHCMLIYGKRPKRPGLSSAEERENLLESQEEDEPEENASEDVPEPGAREREEHPEHERQLRIKPPPTQGYNFKETDD